MEIAFDQKHLNYPQRVNLGAYYTKPEFVSYIYDLIRANISDYEKYCILDSSCGYGSFFTADFPSSRRIGADIDLEALGNAKNLFPQVDFFHQNAVKNAHRSKYGLSKDDKVIIVGNPPYNDMTSLVRNKIKLNISQDIDMDLRRRDLGMSFLLSFSKLGADFVCILHPLSYLIKRSNFSMLRDFVGSYKLIDSLVISSEEFSQTSKTTAFPIIAALYKRDLFGMDYPFIENYEFKTKENKVFKLSHFDPISRYINKYPNSKSADLKDIVAKFWTLRDINALKRNKTFIQKECKNAVFVTKEKLDYFCYVDVFKRYTSHIPYYLGNCDIMIDNQSFVGLKPLFRYESICANPHLSSKVEIPKIHNQKEKIDDYFKNLLGDHYVDQEKQ